MDYDEEVRMDEDARELDYYASSYSPMKERIWKRIIVSRSDVITESRQTDEYITRVCNTPTQSITQNTDPPLAHYTWREHESIQNNIYLLLFPV